MYVSTFASTDGVPVNVFRPDKLGKNPPVLVVYHGGGLVLGDLTFTDLYCRIIAEYVA